MITKDIKAVGTVAIHEFLLEVQKAILEEGFRVYDDIDNCPTEYFARRAGNYTYTVTLVKEGEAKVEPIVITQENIDTLEKITKKADLLTYADSLGIDVSGDEYQKGVPKKISSMIKENLESRITKKE